MRVSKRHLLTLAIVIILSSFLATFQLPYYIYKPGRADALDPIVEVDGGYKSKGDIHLVTVSGGQATPMQYMLAKFSKFHEVLPLEEVRPGGMSDEEYMHAQLQMMQESQQTSIVVAYEAAGADITIIDKGIFVIDIIEQMPADGVLQVGDLITKVDEVVVYTADDLMDYIEQKKIGDVLNLEIERDEEKLLKQVTLDTFPYDDKVGIGVHLMTNRDVEVHPEVEFSSGKIGGPSAGLMFALEIYNQLTEEDLTKGYKIAGTGEVDYDGRVKRIGGIDKKVIAADKEGCDIFFAPHEEGAPQSNYEIAKQTAEEINSSMTIVPVDTFEEALNYLQQLEWKETN